MGWVDMSRDTRVKTAATISYEVKGKHEESR